MISKLEQIAQENHKKPLEVKQTYQKHYRILTQMYPWSKPEWRREKACKATEGKYQRRK